MRSRTNVVLVCLLTLAAAPAMATIQSVVIGTGAPPATIGGIPMIAFPPDGRATVPATYTTVPTPLGGDLTFDNSVYHAKVPSDWNNWSNGYTGDVYYTTGLTNPNSRTITLPAGTGAFYLYTEADIYSTFTFTITSGTATQTLDITTPDGATGVGFWDDAGGTLTSVTVTSTTSFAVGEFGIAGPSEPIPALGTMGLVILALALGLAGMWVTRRLVA